MSQSTIIFAYLFLAFAIFVIARGELPTYLGFFGVGGTASSASSGAGSDAALAIQAAGTAGQVASLFR